MLPVETLGDVNKQVQDKVDQYYAEMEEELEKVIGHTKNGLTREGRSEGDVALGNFWTDAMRNLVGADIAVYNNGGIRASIDPGEIKAGEIYEVEPFQNEITKFSMTGQAIKDVVEYSYTRGQSIDLQTSGLNYMILTDGQGNYVDAELTVGGEPIDLNKTYTLLTNNFLASGGDGYHFEGEVLQPAAGQVTNSMIIFIEKLMEEKGSVDYTSEGRIKIKVVE